MPIIARTRFAAPRRTLSERVGTALLDLVDSLSTARLSAIWLALVLACGAAYWLIDLNGGAGLVKRAHESVRILVAC
ncbi:MAG: hypothetical protein JO189_15330 [Deltaproteobacteria bacterium]|nr:hypothetical protein [Deltaproteobacteria bacterium]